MPVSPVRPRLRRLVTLSAGAVVAASLLAPARAAAADPDTVPPVVTPPADVTVEATGPDGAQATWGPAAAEDDVDGVIDAVYCSPPDDFRFPITTFPATATEVPCVAVDAAGNVGRASFTVTVQDTTPPAITLPPPPAAAPRDTDAGRVLTYGTAYGEDLVNGFVTAECLPASGSVFPQGTTEVLCSATDLSGRTGTATFDVTVDPPRDRDDDGVPNYSEALQGTRSRAADTDGDGLLDGGEAIRIPGTAAGPAVACVGDADLTDPLRRDTDRDGLGDGEEILGVRIRQTVLTEFGRYVIGRAVTKGCVRDTDGDGASDRTEVEGARLTQVVVVREGERLVREPIGLRRSAPDDDDTDGDGIPDGEELAGFRFRGKRIQTDPASSDTDRDGAPDRREVARGTSPVDARSVPRR